MTEVLDDVNKSFDKAKKKIKDTVDAGINEIEYLRDRAEHAKGK